MILRMLLKLCIVTNKSYSMDTVTWVYNTHAYREGAIRKVKQRFFLKLFQLNVTFILNDLFINPTETSPKNNTWSSKSTDN